MKFQPVLFILLATVFCVIDCEAQTAQSHVELNTRVLKQLVNPVNDQDFIYLTPFGISRPGSLDQNRAIGNGYIPFKESIYPRDVAFGPTGRLFALVSRNIVVDAILLDSLFLVEIVNDEIVEIGQISTETSPVARLTASNSTISIYEGRRTFRGGSETLIAKFHQLSLSRLEIF
ncbi:MAG: hypothetical protein AB8F78_12585 [Saprospiraceae bacterium]